MTARPDFAQVAELFLELSELGAPERERRLQRVARRSPELRDAVVALLDADASGASVLDGGAGLVLPEALRTLAGNAPADAESSAGGTSSSTISVGTRIGPYRLVELLGRGGMGEVFLAERVDGQFEQQVALKLLKRGMDSDEILRRFLRERQILARLEHPNIARLLDGGVAEDGRPYFVLERVVGSPITQWCRERSASIETRLRLIVTCADAVAAAHRRLVVHRDLKPSNILVTADGDVKLLDFGIAKLLGNEGDESRLTLAESRLLTPAYAAPEQVLGEPVWTSTDVYALGVVLFELLTGRLPRGAERTGTRSADAETIDRPSSVARRLGPHDLETLALPQRERRTLDRRLRGDLDRILLQALRRNPQERYPSAVALAADLRLHLAGRPISAHPDRLAYRVRKFVSRHRVAVAAGAFVVASLAAGVVGTVWQADRARRSAQEARQNALRAERVKEFLIGLFEVADPEAQSGGELTAAELLEQSGKRLATELAEEPLIQADLLEAVARIERSLGRLEPAADLATRSLELREVLLPEDDPAVASARATVGAVRLSEGRLEEAEASLRDALARLERTEPPASLTLARVRSDYSNVLFWQGRAAESEALERQVYEAYRDALGEESLQAATHLRNLGLLLDELDRLDEAEAAFRASQAVIERTLGPDHPSLAQSWSNLAVVLDRRGVYAEAEELHRRTLELRERRLGARHPATGQAVQLLALFLLQRGRLDESEVLYLRALDLFRSINPEHFEVGKATNGLALIAERRGDRAGAERMLREVVALFRKVLGEEHPFIWQATGNLARTIAAQGRLEEAEVLQREVLGRLERLAGTDEDVAIALDRLGDTVRRAGRPDEAATLHRRALALWEGLYGAEHAYVGDCRLQLGASLLRSAEESARAEARVHLEKAAAILERDPARAARAREARALLEEAVASGSAGPQSSS